MPTQVRYLRMRSSRILLALCLLAALYAFSQPLAPVDPQAVAKLLQEMATLQSIWGVPTAQPVPGSALQLIEKSREKGPEGRTVLQYNFKVTGLPTDATYYMEYWPIGGSIHPMQKVATGLHINQEGLIVCSPEMPCGNKSQAAWPMQIAIPRTALGESHRFVVRSEKDPKVWVTGINTPFPLTVSAGACQLEFMRVTPNGELFVLKGTGFPANQDITLHGNSAGEEHNSTAHTDAQGTFLKAELPFVAGKTSGTLEDTVTSGDCHPSLSAQWGEGSRDFQ